MHTAVHANNLEICKLLIERPDCDLNARTTDIHKATPIHLAAAYGYCDIVRLLMSKKQWPNTADTLFMLLHHMDLLILLICFRMSMERIILLQKLKKVIRVCISHGYGHTHMIRYLKLKGFDPVTTKLEVRSGHRRCSLLQKTYFYRGSD